LASIGSVGDAYDNAVAESVFGLFKNEALTAGSPVRTGLLRTLADIEKVTADYLDWYNNDRLHSLLDHTTPEEFEQSITLTNPAHQPATPPTRRRHDSQDWSHSERTTLLRP
jgi:putative transposase